MKRKVYIFSAIVVALCALFMIKAPYLAWSIGKVGEGVVAFVFIMSVVLIIGLVWLLQGYCLLHTPSMRSLVIRNDEKLIKRYRRIESKFSLSLKEVIICYAVFIAAFIIYGIFFVRKFDYSRAYGNCVFSSTCSESYRRDVGYVHDLYTKDGRTIVNHKRYSLDFTKHEDCDISKEFLSIDGWRKSCVIECPGGPYFCYLKKVDIDQVDKGRDYDYNRYDDKVYYQYERYRIIYLVSIYNSEGRYVDDFETTDNFYYYPDKKKIDGNEYSYTVYGEDLKYDLYDELAEIVHDDLVDYVSQMNREQESSMETYSTPSNSNTSSRATLDDGLLYEGIYTISGQGYCAEMGTYTGSTLDMSCRIKIYDDYILLGAERHDYVRTSGGWRIYKGVENFGVTPFYKVNPNTFAMSKYTIMPNQYSGGVNTVTYAMEKGETTFNRHSNNGGEEYNSGSGNSSSNSNSTARQRSGRIKKECRLCGGTGKVVSTKGVSFGMEKWCSECGKQVPSNHHHETCPSCKGKGEW